MITIWYLVAVAVSAEGLAFSAAIDSFTRLDECFAAREYRLHKAEMTDPKVRMDLGANVICIARNHQSH